MNRSLITFTDAASLAAFAAGVLAEPPFYSSTYVVTTPNEEIRNAKSHIIFLRDDSLGKPSTCFDTPSSA